VRLRSSALRRARTGRTGLPLKRRSCSQTCSQIATASATKAPTITPLVVAPAAQAIAQPASTIDGL
jgi:hypothetical protein